MNERRFARLARRAVVSTYEPPEDRGSQFVPCSGSFDGTRHHVAIPFVEIVASP